MRKNAGWNIYVFSLLFVALWCISPPLFISGFARIVALLTMIVALRIRYIYHPTYFFVLAFFVIYTLSTGVLKQGIGYVLGNIQTYIILAIAYVAVNEYSKSKDRRITFAKITRVIEWIYPIWMIITLRAYSTIPNISRILANNNNENVMSWSRQGIGGYGMIYSLVFYNIILLYMLINKKKSGVLVVVNYILSLMTIVLAGYSIALISILLGSVLIITIRGKKLENIVLAVAIFFMIYFIFNMFQESIFSGLLNMTQGTMYEHKMADIIASFYGNGAQGTLESRTVLYEYSWNVFLKNPIVGSALLENFMFGGHSFFLDMFAKFGLLGGLPFLYLILYFPIKCMRDNREFSLSLALLVLIIFIGGLNNLSAAFAPIVYIIYPAHIEDKE